MQPLPVASLHVLSIALCVAGALSYDAARRALTVRCPLCAGSPFPSPTGKRTAEPDMRSMLCRIDRSGMLDARPQCMSLRLIHATRHGRLGADILEQHAVRQQIADRGEPDGTAPVGNSAQRC